MVILESKWLTALWAQPIGIPDAFGSGVGAVEEVVVVQPTIRGDWAIAAVLHVEYVDIIEFLWFVAANEEGISVVAHIRVYDW